ncbi:unnamed protein product [Nezara viridula]|uniref:SET domain-containing protein n=1 Tax=Nezara viridula TaxID=85310 RepID=A0A9P0MMF7_NEZVI|nr:unnamed protein product [Nezara viridula]
MALGYEIRHCSDRKGKGLFATKDFSENEVIFEEKPLVSCQFAWNETYGYLACHHCLRPMEDTEENVRRLTNNPNIVLPFPELCPTNKSLHRYCDQCGVGFCSDSCKQQSWAQYHEYLCFGTHPALKNLYEAWKTMHYPPETASVMLIARMIAIIEQAQDKDSAISAFLEFAHGTSEERDGSILKFLGEQFFEKFECLRLLMSDIFQTCHAQSLVTEEGLKTLFAIAGRNSQGIGSSVFSIWVKNVEKFELSEESRKEINEFIDNVYLSMDRHVGCFLNNEGSGLYRLERCINHSCLPNASSTFPYGDYTLALVAKTAISAGEEICISYLDECELERSKHSRNKHLREYYLFECECEKCLKQSDEPDVTSEEETDSDMDEE